MKDDHRRDQPRRGQRPDDGPEPREGQQTRDLLEVTTKRRATVPFGVSIVSRSALMPANASCSFSTALPLPDRRTSPIFVRMLAR
jgi:hypothetical protein